MTLKERRRLAWQSLSAEQQVLIAALYRNEKDNSKSPDRFTCSALEGARWVPYAATRSDALWTIHALPRREKERYSDTLRRWRGHFSELQTKGLLSLGRGELRGFRKGSVVWVQLSLEARAMARAGGAIAPVTCRGLKKNQWYMLQRLCEMGPRNLNNYPSTNTCLQLVGKGLGRIEFEHLDESSGYPPSSNISWLKVTDKGRRKYEAVQSELEQLWGRASGLPQPSDQGATDAPT